MPRFGLGMLSAGSAVAPAMLLSCSPLACSVQGFVVETQTETIGALTVSDVACDGVTPPCQATDDAGACSVFQVLPVATGNCHVDVALANGTTFSTDVKIVHGSTGCSGFYPAISADSVIEVP